MTTDAYCTRRKCPLPLLPLCRPALISRADVAGFHLGVKARDLEATLTRLFGPVVRTPGKPASRWSGKLAVNELKCMHLPDGIHHAETGAVCVTALFDKDDVVRAIQAERVFDFFEAEIFRRVVTRRYGPVASAQTLADSYELGWGPAVDPGVAFGARNTLVARYEATHPGRVTASVTPHLGLDIPPDPCFDRAWHAWR